MKLRFITISSLLFLSFYTNSQQLIFKTYTMEDGLVSNPVRRILQDKKGFIWIATGQGLSKYNGHNFTNYTTSTGLSHNLVNDLYEAANGKLYVAENNGTVDILQHDAILRKAAFRNVIINQFFVTKDNRVLAATDSSGLHEINNGTFIKPIQDSPHSTYSDIAELNDSLLIGGWQGSIRILTRQLELFGEIRKPKEFLIHKIYKDSKNRVWLGTNNGLKIVSHLRESSFTVLPAPYNLPLPGNHIVTDILEDVNANLWIATTHGLVKINPDDSWQIFSEEDGLPSAGITCLYEDKEKNIWIGSNLGLVKLVVETGIRIYTDGKGVKSNNAFGFLLPLNKNIFLAGAETGVKLFDTRNNLFTSVASGSNLAYRGLVRNSIHPLFFGFNNYFGKYDSVNRFIVQYIPQGSLNNDVFCSIIDTNEIIFNGTQTGLVIGAGKLFYNEIKLPYRISDFLIDEKGYLWVGTWENGLYRIHYANISKTDNDRIDLTVQNFSDLLPDKSVRSMFEDSKGNIWIGTRYQGIVQLSPNYTDQYTAKYFDLQQGLTSNWIRTIGEDATGCIWIGSDIGIDKLVPAEKSFRIFNFSRINNCFTQINSIASGSDHSLWLTSNRGLINIIDGEIENTPAPPVYITSIELGDTSFNCNTHPAEKKVRLKYYQNQAAFEFSAPAFINEKQILYSYRLWGTTDTMWSKPANLHNVSYASLQPGNYRFEVRTKGWNEEWGVPANFEFNIRPPYWRTWWFYSLVGSLVLLLFYAFYLYRIRQILNLEKMRNRIATDLHDDIGSTLTNINMLSEISRKNLEHPAEAEKFLHRITDEVTASGQALNDIIWSVNTRNDSMEETLSRMRRYAAELFDKSTTTCHLNLDETIEGKKLNMEQRRDVYLIYKESMNNIYKHAMANNVWIDVHLRNGKLHLKIKDDGKGFDPSVVTNRNGLRNIRSRIMKWKGNVIIKTVPGNGTLIEIMIPLAG